MSVLLRSSNFPSAGLKLHCAGHEARFSVVKKETWPLSEMVYVTLLHHQSDFVDVKLL